MSPVFQCRKQGAGSIVCALAHATSSPIPGLGAASMEETGLEGNLFPQPGYFLSSETM